jgi:calcium-dependent protein kinase
MKDLIGNKVTFFKIADFYDPQYIIGKGSSARVLLVQKLYDSTKFAVKSIDKSYLFKSENGMDAFQSEVRILNLLSSTNTEKNKLFLKLYEIFEGDLTYYLVVELMQGKTLQDELDALKQRKDKSIMKPENTKTIMRRLLEGVAIMHS